MSSLPWKSLQRFRIKGTDHPKMSIVNWKKQNKTKNSIQLVGCFSSCWTSQDPKLIWKDIIYLRASGDLHQAGWGVWSYLMFSFQLFLTSPHQLQLWRGMLQCCFAVKCQKCVGVQNQNVPSAWRSEHHDSMFVFWLTVPLILALLSAYGTMWE